MTCRIEPVEAAIGIGLEHSQISVEMALGVIAGPGRANRKYRSRRITGYERAIIVQHGSTVGPLRVHCLANTGTAVSSPAAARTATTWAQSVSCTSSARQPRLDAAEAGFIAFPAQPPRQPYTLVLRHPAIAQNEFDRRLQSQRRSSSDLRARHSMRC
jgi:hypothetical protein